MGLIGIGRREGRGRRFRFSLNGLAIQLSAFALSFTLVALLVVSGSKAAFVEPSEALAEYVPVGAVPTDEPQRPRRSPSVPLPAPVPSPEAPEAPVSPSLPTPSSTPSSTPEAPAPGRTAIELTDSDAGTAMFGIETVLSPGVRADRCIDVTYAGSGDGIPVLLYAAGTRGDLGPFLDLTIEVGAAGIGSSGGCSGFVPASTVFSGTLADFVTAHSTYATGREAWTPRKAEDSRTFRFGLSLRNDPASSGRSVTFGFTWESRED